jgi:transposase InsO family protein
MPQQGLHRAERSPRSIEQTRCGVTQPVPIKALQLYTPRTNGKAERFIKTAINEWAYAYTFQNSDDRTASLPAWTHQYNWHRPHASLNQLPPISRAGFDDNNLLTHHT